MLTEIKYSPKTHLKDVVKALQDLGDEELGTELIPVDEEDLIAVNMRKLVYDYWWYAEIGCDFQGVFVQRMRNTWGMWFNTYYNIIHTIATKKITNGYVRVKHTSSDNTFTAGTSKTEDLTRSGVDSFSRTQHDKEYSRASQVHDLDSELNNSTTYGSEVVTETTNAGADTTYNVGTVDDVMSDLSVEALKQLMEGESVYHSFVLKFAPLFMEVL